jgi:hypothetical protein
MVSISDFITTGEGGFQTPRFGRLANVGIGATFGAFLTGVTSLILGLFDIPISLLGGLGEFLATVVRLLVTLPGVLLEEGFLASWFFIIQAGPAGLVVALAIGATAAFVFRWVISRA